MAEGEQMHSCRHILTISFLAFLLVDPAPATVVYVSQSATGDGSGSSWGNACTTIATGLDASSSGDGVWVKSATYVEAITLKEGVALYGGFLGAETSRKQRDWQINPTVIEAPGPMTITVVGSSYARLDGFTVIAGSGRNAVWCDWTSPIIANCTIRGNPGGTGGGLRCTYGSLVLINCTIVNSPLKGISCGSSTLTLVGCTIRDNDEPGIHLSNSSATITDSTITNCSTGVSCENSQPVMVGCRITDNSFSGVYSRSPDPWPPAGHVDPDCMAFSPRLTNCLISGNGGSGVSCYRTSADLFNCTLADNAGAEISQVRFHFTPWTGNPYEDCLRYPRLSNCIIWDATPVGIIYEYYQQFQDPDDVEYYYWELMRTESPPHGEGLDIDYSCIADGWPGVGNIDTDPLFVDPAGGDYHLQAGSPCIDSGSNEAAWDIPLDLDRKIRIWNGVVDMGAYEFGSVLPTPTPRPRQLWLLDGFGQVHHLPAPTPTP